MTSNAPLSLESLRLRLINNPNVGQDSFLNKEGITYLIKALAYADQAFSVEIENALVKAAHVALPEVIKALSNENLNVRSVAAMVLIRIGAPAEPALTQAYAKYHKRASVKWVIEFIFHQLACPVPSVANVTQSKEVLERVS